MIATPRSSAASPAAGQPHRRAALGQYPRVLEIGCGTGFLSEALLARLPAASLTATDIAPAMLERARQRLGAREG
jgi:malonyl-CoA O-methyltransferase